MPSEILIKVGTATVATCTSMQSLSTSTTSGGAQTAKIDLGGGTALLAQQYLVRLATAFTSAPTAGGAVEVYVGFSSSSVSGTDNTAGLDGADQNYDGYTTDVANAKRQLTFVGVLSACNNTTTQVADVGTFSPLNRWAQIAIVNTASQALASTANIHLVTVVPLKDEAQ